jgi:hypothetical protein
LVAVDGYVYDHVYDRFRGPIYVFFEAVLDDPGTITYTSSPLLLEEDRGIPLA